MKKYLIHSGLFTATIFAVLLLVSCVKNKIMTLATPIMIEVLNVTSGSATVNCNITSQGNSRVSESGLVFALTRSPDITKSREINTQGNGKFTCILKGLLPNTTYYVRAYAINNLGTAYGDEFTIKTAYIKFWVPDAQFRVALKMQFATSFDAKDSLLVSDANIYGFKGTINVTGYSIVSLSGIEYFPALTDLYCNSNKLTSLDLSKNSALTFLVCPDNLLTSLDVSKNVALTALICDGNKLTSLDLSKNIALKDLCCTNNLLTSLDIRSQTELSPYFISIIRDHTTLINNGNTGLTSLKINNTVQQYAEILNVKTIRPGCVISTWNNGIQVCGNYNPITNTCQ